MTARQLDPAPRTSENQQLRVDEPGPITSLMKRLSHVLFGLGMHCVTNPDESNLLKLGPNSIPIRPEGPVNMNKACKKLEIPGIWPSCSIPTPESDEIPQHLNEQPLRITSEP